jgi:hypothetical protein
MTANELKIGNYVNVPNTSQCPFRIDAFEHLSNEFIKVAMKVSMGGFEVHPLTWYGGDLTPIELTERWLNKFELEHSEIRGRWFKDKFVVFKQKYLDPLSILEENKFYFQMVDCQGNVSTSSFEIKYVHQLQNLYFALTGEELILKSEQ